MHYKGLEVTDVISSMISTGRSGIAIAMLSHCNNFRMSFQADSSINEEPEKVIQQLELAIEKLLELGKSRLEEENAGTRQRSTSLNEMSK